MKFVTAKELRSKTDKRLTTAELIQQFNDGQVIVDDESANDSGVMEGQRKIVALISNFRGFRKGKQGKATAALGERVLVLRGLPEVIPLDDIDGVCSLLQEYKAKAEEMGSAQA